MKSDFYWITIVRKTCFLEIHADFYRIILCPKMGGGASADAAAERKRRAKRRHRRLKREHHRLNEELRQREGVDDFGVKCFFDDEREPFYFDEEGYAFYLDETRTPYYKDTDGNICYFDENGEIYYRDKQGRQYFFDEVGFRFYKEEDGTKYFLDQHNQKYYKNEQGEPYYVDEFNEVYYLDDKGREYYLDEKGKTLYKDTKGRKYFMHEGEKVLLDSERDEEIKRKEKEIEEADVIEKVPIYMRNRITSHKYVRKGSSQVTVSGVIIQTATPRSWKKGRPWTTEEEEEDLELPCELLVNSNSKDTKSELTTSITVPQEEESEFITPSPVPNIDNPELADEYEVEVVDFDTLKEIQKAAEHKVLRKLLEDELDKRKLPPRQKAQKVGDFPVRIKSDKMKCSITGSVFLGDGTLVLSDYNNKKIKLFDSELEFVSALKLDFFPRSMCARPAEFELFVTFKSAVINAIQVIKVEDERMILLRKINLTEVPFGVSGNNEGLAVTVRTFSGWEIHLINLKGKILRKIIHEIEDKDMLISPHNIFVTKQLKIFVSDRGSNKVHGFSSLGDLECTAEGIRDPKGLCSNLKGSLYVTSPSGMHQVSDGGHKVGTIINRKQIGFHPSNVCYDEEDRLLVLTGDADIMAAFQISDQKGYYYNLRTPTSSGVGSIHGQAVKEGALGSIPASIDKDQGVQVLGTFTHPRSSMEFRNTN